MDPKQKIDNLIQLVFMFGIGIALGFALKQVLATAPKAVEMKPSFPRESQGNTEANAIALQPECLDNCIKAFRTSEKRNGNYIYRATLFTQDPHDEDLVIEMVSGRPYAQSRDTHIPDQSAPLPFGSYSLGAGHRLDDSAARELGGIWIAATPQFITRRTALGLHYDPSFGIDWQSRDTESGTEGCLAAITEADREKLIDFAQQYQPTKLEVY